MIEPRILFSIPYIDQPVSFWDVIRKNFGYHIKDVYFPFSIPGIGSGRPPQPDLHLEQFLESDVLPKCGLINPVVLPNQYEKLKVTILRYLEQCLLRYRIQGITTANFDLAKDIKFYFPELELTASTLMEINSEQQIALLGEVFDEIVPSTIVIRSLRNLTVLRSSFRKKIKLIVNEGCLSGCLYRTQHFYEMSNSAIPHAQSLCNSLLASEPWLRLTGSWILPQHLHLIDNLYDELKLAGRVSLVNPERFQRVLHAYINRAPLFPHEIGGGPASPHIRLNIDEGFYRYTLECDKACVTCSVCKDYWKNQCNSRQYDL